MPGLREEKRKEKARLALPILVEIVQNPHTRIHGKLKGKITYGDLGKMINVIPLKVGNVCGYIRDEITKPRDLPYINCLVVNSKTELPTEIDTGDSPEEAKLKFPSYSSAVYEYPQWDQLLRELDLTR